MKISPILIVFALILPLHGEALMNLNEEKPKPRFAITESVWPAQPGEAVVCLWADDKLAAYSVGVDDNSAPDVEWWLKNAGERGIPVTWFLVSSWINDRMPLGGTAEMWKKVRAAGHDVQSHSATHLTAVGPDWKGIEWEYADSVREIEAKIPGTVVQFLAYPGGKDMDKNDRDIAAKYFLAARGVVGTPNPANAIDYLNVNAMSRSNVGDPKAPWADLNNVLDKSRERGRYYRGWAFPFFHSLDQEVALPLLDFYVSNRDKLWAGLFADVARYGQERDTAQLRTESSEEGKIVLSLTDKMDDGSYDYPLTLKVRLPVAWTSVYATQGSAKLETTMVSHEGGNYGLVKAVPDRGAITLTPVELSPP